MKTDQSMIRCLAAALAFAGLFSCAQLERAKDKASIQAAVRSYNKGLAEASRTGDMKSLEGMASEDVLRKFYYWRAAWEDSNVYMDGFLKDIKFTAVDITGRTAKALTDEDWVYTYRNTKTGQVVVPASGRFYEMEYTLHKKNDTWIITTITVKSEKKKDEHE